MTLIRRQIAPPAERYPAISVATLPTRWSADGDPFPHLRLGPRIQTPWTPVLFAPACQCTTSRFHAQWWDRVRAPIPNAGLQVGSYLRSGGPTIRDMMLPEAHRHAS